MAVVKRAWLLVSLVVLLGGGLRARAEEPGILLGKRLVLHPALATEVRYDSNVFFSSSRLGGSLPASAVIVRVMPSLSLATLSLRRGGITPHKIDFRIRAGLDYREFISPELDLGVHRSLGGEVSAQLSVFPFGAMGFDIYDNYLRLSQPPYSLLPYNFTRNTNVFGLRGRYSPGGTQRLTLTLVQELSYDGFEDVENGPKLSDFDLLSTNTNFRGVWKFLPKTALYVEISQGTYHYLREVAAAQKRFSSYPLRLGVGVIGLITQKLTVNLLGGYGNGFYTEGPSPSTAVVQAEVRYKPTFFSTATLGYRHDFANSFLGQYFDLDALKLSYSHVFYRVVLNATVAWQRMAFQGSEDQLKNSSICKEGEPVTCIPQTDRVDNLINLDLSADYPIKEWLLVGAGYLFQTNRSNSFTRVNQAIVPVTFLKHEAFLRLTVRY